METSHNSSKGDIQHKILSPVARRPIVTDYHNSDFIIPENLTLADSLDQWQSSFSPCGKRSAVRMNLLRLLLKTDKSSDPDLSKVDKKRKCNCKKSRCLKMYCDCFKLKEFCNGCNCIGCMNIPQNEKTRSKMMKEIKARDPLAFEGLLATISKDNNSTYRHIKGCHCKRSNCRKKYCECFQLGIICGIDCTCIDCYNNDK